jgi:hypothetical protein
VLVIDFVCAFASCHTIVLTLRQQVDELLPKGVSSIPELSAALVTISKALDSEMASMPAHEVCERHSSSSSRSSPWMSQVESTCRRP